MRILDKLASSTSVAGIFLSIHDFYKKNRRNKKSKTPIDIIDVGSSIIKEKRINNTVSYDFMESGIPILDIKEKKDNDPIVEPSDDKINNTSYNIKEEICLKLADYYEHKDFIYIGDSKMDGDPIYIYKGNPKVLHTHNIKYIELI